MTSATTQTKGEGSKSPIRIMANIFISFIGAGVLGLPYAFKEAGIVEGILLMTFVGLLSIKAMMLIIDCKYRLMQKEMPRDIGLKTLVKEVVNIKEDEERLIDNQSHSSNNGSSSLSASDYKPQAPGKELSYGDVGYYAIGKLGRWLVELCIIVSQIGFCCAYLIFMSENLSHYLKGVKLLV
ncbi:DgyrCDS4119 [Dimorphilus gyrociliatus]|uniref:DgyrCDS4119 n=1 Tax=Dimorphilus gyrociliatus TaxID=2664684 RepID=A0A7I8VHF8_9ANNE|nr:DgyrCDS4119 [Dimorphilus gyrociliatus]